MLFFSSPFNQSKAPSEGTQKKTQIIWSFFVVLALLSSILLLTYKKKQIAKRQTAGFIKHPKTLFSPKKKERPPKKPHPTHLPHQDKKKNEILY